jgi:hypothetical protein
MFAKNFKIDRSKPTNGQYWVYTWFIVSGGLTAATACQITRSRKRQTSNWVLLLAIHTLYIHMSIQSELDSLKLVSVYLLKRYFDPEKPKKPYVEDYGMQDHNHLFKMYVPLKIHCWSVPSVASCLVVDPPACAASCVTQWVLPLLVTWSETPSGLSDSQESS